MKRFRHWRRRCRAAFGIPAVATTALLLTVTGPGSAAGKNQAPQLDSSRAKVGPGAKVELSGRFAAKPVPNAAPATPAPAVPAQVRIQFKPAGKDHFHQVAKAGTDKLGRYERDVRVKRSGHFRAIAADGRLSEPQWIRVKSRTNSRIAGKDVNLGDKLKVKGRVAPAIGRRPVVVRFGSERVTTKTNPRGRFTAKVKATTTGKQTVRVKARGDRVAAGSKDKAGKATVFRPAEASWYGPGLYGNPMACGGTLQPSTIGVANKSLPCGTKLTLRYGHKTIDVKVVDRGPFAGNREFDLTEATKNKLGFPDVGTVYSSK
jgi:hypothetical protein